MAGFMLITGATGFIGQNLVANLQTQGFQLKAAVRAKSDQLPINVEQIIVGDILDKPDWKTALRDVDCVIHLAGIAGFTKTVSPQNLYDLKLINTIETGRLARAATDSGVRRFIFISSIKVLGESTTQPFSETVPPRPEDEYGQSKLKAENRLIKMCRLSGMEYVIIRPPLIYGQGVKGNILSLINIVKSGFPLPLGGIKNKRSLCSLNNLIDFISTCLTHPDAANEIFHVADKESFSTTVLIKKIGEACGKPVRLVPVPALAMRGLLYLLGKKSIADRLYNSLEVNIKKANEKLGWQPKVSVSEGLLELFRSGTQNGT